MSPFHILFLFPLDGLNGDLFLHRAHLSLLLLLLPFPRIRGKREGRRRYKRQVMSPFDLSGIPSSSDQWTHEPVAQHAISLEAAKLGSQVFLSFTFFFFLFFQEERKEERKRKIKERNRFRHLQHRPRAHIE